MSSDDGSTYEFLLFEDICAMCVKEVPIYEDHVKKDSIKRYITINSMKEKVLNYYH